MIQRGVASFTFDSLDILPGIFVSYKGISLLFAVLVYYDKNIRLAI